MTTADSAADLMAARTQMAVSLGWHIIIACLGVGFPLLVMVAEWRGLRTGDPAWRLLARRWARTLGVLFAVGAVSGMRQDSFVAGGHTLVWSAGRCQHFVLTLGHARLGT